MKTLSHRHDGEKGVIPMTIQYLSNQLHSLSVGGFFNGEKFTKGELLDYLKGVFRPELNTTRWVMEIALPDGRWFFTITRFSDSSDGFDYFIPDTREQEKSVIALLDRR